MMFCVLTDVRFPCPRTHRLHVRKLAAGFIQRGFHYRELRNLRDIAHLEACDVLYVSNHFTSDPLHRPVSAWLAQHLFRALSLSRAQLLLWNFHTLRHWQLLEGTAARTVHLGEDLSSHAIQADAVLREFRERVSVLPLRYSSPLHPTYARYVETPRKWDFNFVGHGYRREWTRHCSGKYRALIRNTPPVVSETLRINSFRRAEVNLVFHAEANVAKGIIVERFAEALSLGGIIFHDHPRITQEFGDLRSVVQVGSIAQIDREFERVMSLDAREREGLRRLSFERWRDSGLSYFDQAGRILRALGVNGPD